METDWLGFAVVTLYVLISLAAAVWVWRDSAHRDSLKWWQRTLLTFFTGVAVPLW